MGKIAYVLLTAILLGLLVVAAGYYKFCYVGHEYSRSASPDGRFVVVRDSVLTLDSFLPAMPGSGSDHINGYMRVYDASGRKLGEAYATGIPNIECVWLDDSVWFMGQVDAQGNELTIELPR